MSKWTKLGEQDLRLAIVDAVERHKSMRAAAASIPMNFQTFRTYAKRFGVWSPNQAGRGLRRLVKSTIDLDEVLQGLRPETTRGWLKKQLIKAGIKKNECEECGISEWRGKPLSIHVDHVNGNPWDHRLENLRMLCPNCHSQTPTYCSRNARVVERQTHSV